MTEQPQAPQVDQTVSQLQTELTAAKEQLSMVESERNHLQDELETLVTEARGVAWTDFYGWAKDKDGLHQKVKISVTCRSAVSGLDAANQLLDAARELKSKNLFPFQTQCPTGQPSAPAQTAAPVTQPAAPGTPPAAPGTPPATPTQPPVSNGAPAPTAGTGRLKALTIAADLKASFDVEGLKWPLKDGRGAYVIAKLFDPDLGWTEAHFQVPAVYTEVHFGNLFLDWEKEGKYYNVKRIHA